MYDPFLDADWSSMLNWVNQNLSTEYLAVKELFTFLCDNRIVIVFKMRLYLTEIHAELFMFKMIVYDY